ncbi:MAG TPA: hypothetical protein VN035_13345 [Microbacterium sp.]|nr:hypothetical protein [Microbacterium sp.]
MSFFPPDPEIPEPDDDMESNSPRWWAPPEDEVPALAPVSEILAITDHVAIALIGAAVFRDGVEFRVERRLRRHGLASAEWNELCATFMEHHPWGGPSGAQGRLRFGLVLGDGQKVLLDGGGRFTGDFDPTAEPRSHVLSRHGGSGGGSNGYFSGSDSLWLWPLPPSGPIEFVLQWPALGIGEARTILDGSELAACAPRATSLWP